MHSPRFHPDAAGRRIRAAARAVRPTAARPAGPAAAPVAALAAALALAAAGCSTPRDPGGDDGASPLRTDRTAYTLERTARGLEVDIPFTFTNTTGRTVYVVNCNGIAPPSLVKREGRDWVTAWSPAVPLCLSPPIVIEAGTTYADTLDVVAGAPGSNVQPQFMVDEVEGTYRLVWGGVVYDYDADRQGFGEPVPAELRVSNTFVLRLD